MVERFFPDRVIARLPKTENSFWDNHNLDYRDWKGEIIVTKAICQSSVIWLCNVDTLTRLQLKPIRLDLGFGEHSAMVNFTRHWHWLCWARLCGPLHPVDRMRLQYDRLSRVANLLVRPLRKVGDWLLWRSLVLELLSGLVWSQWLCVLNPHVCKPKVSWTKSMATSLPRLSLLVARTGNAKLVRYSQPMSQGALNSQCRTRLYYTGLPCA